MKKRKYTEKRLQNDRNGRELEYIQRKICRQIDRVIDKEKELWSKKREKYRFNIK